MIEQAGGIAFGVDLDSAGRAARAVPGQIVEPKTRKQIEELLKSTRLPFIAKGIMTVEEAQIAVAPGARGIVVSIHGGRRGFSMVETGVFFNRPVMPASEDAGMRLS